MSKKLTARQIAALIAADLFSNGSGQHAAHLVLTSQQGRNLGGWCEKAVRDRIEDLLRPHLK